MPNRKHIGIVRLAADADEEWRRLLAEARQIDALEMQPLLLSTILHAGSFEEAVLRRVTDQLGGADIAASVILDVARQALVAEPQIGSAMRRDAVAVIERDPAASRLLDPVLFYKGYHAIQTHRIAHWLWRNGRRDLALWLESRASEVFQTDIHPAARIGAGILLDHATGLVVGETTVIDDDVSILHAVTLGGTGTETGDRHPKIRRGVLIGAGASILGNIEVGESARVAAGSVVLHPVAAHTTVAGVPARQVADSRHLRNEEPSRTMDQLLEDEAYDSFTYVI